MPASVTFDDVSSLFRSEDLPSGLQEKAGAMWAVCGHGVFSWSVFKFYKIYLLTASGHFDPTEPYLLVLSYLRKLSAQQIVSISMQEIQRLATPSTEQLLAWRTALERIVPDVALSDCLIGWFQPGRGVCFFSATAELGSVMDPEFASAFAAIWLDARTQRPALRQGLLGLENA
ncbi:MAG: hypothetical protein WCJ34_01700 [Alcaligenaceae bacterium]